VYGLTVGATMWFPRSTVLSSSLFGLMIIGCSPSPTTANVESAVDQAPKTSSPAPRAKDGELGERSKARIRDFFTPGPGPDPWFVDRVLTVGPAKDNKGTVVLSGKCKVDLTKNDTFQAFACRAGETVKVRYEFLLAFVDDCQCWEPSKSGGISANQLGR
jgi:hypothetical protein